MTVFEYNGMINDFVPRSLHFFERETYRTSVILGTPKNLNPQISCDPEGRMAAVRVFSSHLALIPVPKDIPEHSQDDSKNADLSLQSHVVNFATQIDPRLKVVKNLIFLPGFQNPAMAILYDRGSNEGENDAFMPLRTSLNHSHKSYPKDTCAIMIVAVEPAAKHHRGIRSSLSAASDSTAFQFTVINCIEGLPFDSEGLHALPKPVGGLFVSCANLLLWCDISSSTAPFTIPLNQFASLTYSGRINPIQEQLNISSLLDCQILPLESSNATTLRCIVITKHGEKLLVTISRTGRTLSFFNIERIEHGAKISPSPSDLIQWNDELVFVASEGGGSQLLSLVKQSASNEKDKEAEEVTQTPQSTTKSLISTVVPLNDDIDAFLYGEDVEMATAPPPSNPVVTDEDYLMSLESEEVRPTKKTFSKKKSVAYDVSPQFVLIDELESLGPMIDLAVGSNEIGSTELVTIGGAYTDRSSGTFYPGSLNVLTQRIPLSIQLSFNLPDTRKIWTINSSGSETKYLVASTSSSTLVLTTSQARIVELEESDFYLEGPTLYCSAFASGKLIVQVYPSGMKLLHLNTATIVKEIQADFSNVKRFTCGSESIYLLQENVLKEFDQELKVIRSLSNVSSFTVKDNLLFVSLESGSLIIMKGNEIVFENSFFSRLPVALTNRKNQAKETNTIEISQRIISMDILKDVLVVRFECQNSIGLVSYRISPDGNLLQRITSETIGLISNSTSVESVQLSDELILFDNFGDLPVYTLALNSRNFPRLHCLLSNQLENVKSLASYNQTSLMVLKGDGVVSIIDLQKSRKKFNLNWQSGWYLKRVNIGDVKRVPTHVTFHPISKTYLVASAELESDFVLPSDEYAQISDNPNALAYNGKVPKLFAATSNCLSLLNPISWTVVDSISETFLPFESVTCIRSLELETRQTATGFSSFLTVGTAYQKSEDRPIRGRALVFDVAEVVPEPGKPETNRKLRLKGITDFKGPVMALTPLRQGHVVISAGAKVIINTFEEDEKFAGVAFQDIGTCTLSLASLKSFFVTADLVNSIAFLAFQAEPLARIHELGRDFGQNLQCTAVEFLVNSAGNVMTVVSDDQGGLHFFSYAPNSKSKNALFL